MNRRKKPYPEGYKKLMRYIDFSEFRYYSYVNFKNESDEYDSRLNHLNARVNEICERYLGKPINAEELAMILSEFNFRWKTFHDLKRKSAFETKNTDHGATGLLRLTAEFEQNPENILEISIKHRNPPLDVRDSAEIIKDSDENPEHEFREAKRIDKEETGILHIKGRYTISNLFWTLVKSRVLLREVSEFEQFGLKFMEGKSMKQIKLGFQEYMFEVLQQYFVDNKISLKKPKRLPTLFAELMHIINLIPDRSEHYDSDNEYFRKNGQLIFDRIKRKNFKAQSSK